MPRHKKNPVFLHYENIGALEIIGKNVNTNYFYINLIFGCKMQQNEMSHAMRNPAFCMCKKKCRSAGGDSTLFFAT